MRITPLKKAAKVLLVVILFFVIRRFLIVVFLGLKILGHSESLDAWEGAVRHQTVEHDGIPIDIYGDPSFSPILIVHGVNPTGKNNLDLVRISEALAQVGYQVFVPDLREMKKQHIAPEEAADIKSVFQFIGKDAALACFSYGCGPAMVAAADPEINSHVRFALAFGGYFDIREALEFTVTGPKSPIAYLKWVYLGANSDLVADKDDQARLRVIAQHRLEENAKDEDVSGQLSQLSPEGKALFDIFTANTPEEFRARLNAGPESLQRRLDALSPSMFVRQLRAPLILVHGMHDPSIPAQQAVRFAEAARANGLACSLTLLRMYGHTNPVLPEIGVRSLVSFYFPESFRFLTVVNQVISNR
jgi:pimeloyl-ACP methyl ester carboxylesterase